jgi:hypothetical protein
MRQTASGSFLKKRTEKLLSVQRRGGCRRNKLRARCTNALHLVAIASSIFGFPLLSRDGTAFSSFFGLPVLSQSKRRLTRSFGLPLLVANATPFSTLFNLPVLIKGRSRPGAFVPAR